MDLVPQALCEASSQPTTPWARIVRSIGLAVSGMLLSHHRIISCSCIEYSFCGFCAAAGIVDVVVGCNPHDPSIKAILLNRLLTIEYVKGTSFRDYVEVSIVDLEPPGFIVRATFGKPFAALHVQALTCRVTCICVEHHLSLHSQTAISTSMSACARLCSVLSSEHGCYCLASASWTKLARPGCSSLNVISRRAVRCVLRSFARGALHPVFSGSSLSRTAVSQLSTA
jgi:hypothetical protein